MNFPIVVRAYNQSQYLGLLLEGTRQQTIADVEIIPVDSGSTLNTLTITEAFIARILHTREIDPIQYNK